MKKYFCDSCGEEIERNVIGERVKNTTYLPSRYAAHKDTRILVEVIAGTKGIWNNGELCLNCLEWALKCVIDEIRKG